MVVVLILLIQALAVNSSMIAFLLRAATILPAITWGLREWRAQSRQAEIRERLSRNVDTLWSELLQGQIEPKRIIRRSRRIQDQLFAQRRDGPEVLDWVYRWFRPRDEAHMADLAAELVSEFSSTSRA